MRRSNGIWTLHSFAIGSADVCLGPVQLGIGTLAVTPLAHELTVRHQEIDEVVDLSPFVAAKPLVGGVKVLQSDAPAIAGCIAMTQNGMATAIVVNGRDMSKDDESKLVALLSVYPRCGPATRTALQSRCSKMPPTRSACGRGFPRVSKFLSPQRVLARQEPSLAGD